MHGNKLYAVCIEVWKGHDGWRARAQFDDFGHCDRGSIHGHISTKYTDDLSYVVDTIKADVGGLGIEFARVMGTLPGLYYLNDGEHGCDPPPENWRELVKAEAARIGFRSYDWEIDEND